MIEYFKDRETGEIYPNQTVLCEYSVFWRDNMLREEDKTPKKKHKFKFIRSL